MLFVLCLLIYTHICIHIARGGAEGGRRPAPDRGAPGCSPSARLAQNILYHTLLLLVVVVEAQVVVVVVAAAAAAVVVVLRGVHHPLGRRQQE